MSSHNFINYKEFENVDIRIGTVIEAYEYNKLKKLLHNYKNIIKVMN